MLWLHKNRTEMYSIHNKGKYVVAERIIKNLKSKVYKHMTVVSKKMYNKLNETVDKCNKTYHRAINMKPANAQLGAYIEYGAWS